MNFIQLRCNVKYLFCIKFLGKNKNSEIDYEDIHEMISAIILFINYI